MSHPAAHPNAAYDPRKLVDVRSAWPLMRRFWQFARPHRRSMWAILAVMLLNLPLPMAAPLIVQRLVDDAVESASTGALVPWGAALFGLTLLSVALGIGAASLTAVFQSRVIRDIRWKLYAAMQRLSHRDFSEVETGQLMSRQVDDVNNLGGLMADSFARALTEGVRGVAGVALIFYLEWRLAAAALLLVLLIFGFQYLFSARLRRAAQIARMKWAEVSQAIHEAISGHALVKSTASESREAARFAVLLDGSVRSGLRQELTAVVSDQVVLLIRGLVTVVAILGGVYLIVTSEFTVGGLFGFAMYLTVISNAFGTVARVNPALQRSLASLERIYDVIDAAPEVVDPSNGIRLGRVSGEIRFDRVSFAYDETRVLEEISVTIPANAMVALVGPSGAGKTTFAHLIPRFFDPSAGTVSVDGYDLRKLDLRSLREQIGLVAQDVFLFGRSVAENIAYGSPGATSQEVREAAASANALGFIEALPEGFDTRIGERGVKLSGGQRQRLAIAREILRNPGILILDEATSSLDSETEALIQAALERLLAGRTSIVIAHRLSTVVRADRLLVLDNGRIVESGRHEELLARGGLYSRLYRSQFRVHPSAAAEPLAVSVPGSAVS